MLSNSSTMIQTSPMSPFPPFTAVQCARLNANITSEQAALTALQATLNNNSATAKAGMCYGSRHRKVSKGRSYFGSMRAIHNDSIKGHLAKPKPVVLATPKVSTHNPK